MTTLNFTVSASGPAAGYPGHHVSNPNLLPQLMEAATNCVRDYVRVERGERVLVVAEIDTDPLVVGSLASAATLAGAEVATITVPSFSAGGFDPNAPGEMLMGAFERADVVISCTYFEFAHSTKTFFDKLFSSRRRVCSLIMGATAGCMVTGGRFPIELMQEIGDRALEIFKGAKKIRYLTASGTDLTFDDPKGYTSIAPMQPGSWSIFPPMGINFYPENSNGVIVFDESTLHGRPAAPIKLYIENNFVSKVEAGALADAATIDAFSNGRYYMRHSVVGLNPKTRMSNAPQFERERAAGTCYLGVDGTPEGDIDRSKPGFAHLDVIFDTPTVYVDDQLMVDRRKLLLLDDPTLHEVARKYGDPKRILAQNPFLW